MIKDLGMCKNYAQIKMDVQKISTLIVESRKMSGQTQQDVAEWIGVSRRKIVDFENNNIFDIELLCILCEKFDIDLTFNFK